MLAHRKTILSSDIVEFSTGLTHKVELFVGTGTFKEEPALNGTTVYQLSAYKRNVSGNWESYIINVNADLDVMIEYYKSVVYKLLR